jgi:hypothetical protein
MSSDVTITCDGQWPAKPMYSKYCHGAYVRKGGALWPTTEYARDQAKMIGGWRVDGERDQCPACQAMIASNSTPKT